MNWYGINQNFKKQHQPGLNGYPSRLAPASLFGTKKIQ